MADFRLALPALPPVPLPTDELAFQPLPPASPLKRGAGEGNAAVTTPATTTAIPGRRGGANRDEEKHHCQLPQHLGAGTLIP
jgi:hypothetical protein